MKSTLGKVISVIFLVIGVLTLLTIFGVDLGLGVLLGYATGSFNGVASLVGLLSAVTIIAGIAYLLAGVFGLAGKKKPARIMAWVILIASLIGFVMSIVNKSIAWGDVVGLVLPILYFVAK